MSAEGEALRGLPAPLPPGEELLWQGAPSWRALAVEALHVRKVAVYFGLLAAWRVLAARADGESLASAAASVAFLLALGAGAIALLGGFAWLVQRTTVYSVTNRRVVMRIGVALPLTLNIPFRIVGSAGLRLRRDGTGDIPLELTGDGKIAYLALWPHARPWRVKRPEPMMRAVPGAEAVAQLLARELAAAAGQIPRTVEAGARTAAAPAGLPAAA
jgi:hypothetical protein